jgi:hypothetical protein
LIERTKGFSKTLLGQAEAHHEKNRVIATTVSQEAARTYATAGSAPAGYSQVKRKGTKPAKRKDDEEETP